MEHHEDIIEGIVGKVSDIKESEMKEVSLKGYTKKILLIKQGGVISALGNKCPHYGAPLIDGVLGKGRIRCPWHGACFNIETGDIEDFPGCRNLPKYKVEIINGKIKVQASKSVLKAEAVERSMMTRNLKDKRNYVVVGGGPAGMTCVETLRSSGFTGRIQFILGEPYLPYDRVTLTKDFDATIDQIVIRNSEFYEKLGVELKMDVRMTKIKPNSKKIVLNNNENIQYDKMFLALGASPRQLLVPGTDFKNIFYLRSIDDLISIRNSVTSKTNVVIIGSSFIGLEIAATLSTRVKSIKVVSTAQYPLIFGQEVGDRIMKLFKSKGIEFHLRTGVQEFNSDDGTNVSSVLLEDDDLLPAEVVIISIGIIPNTRGIDVDKNASLTVDSHLRTNMEDIYAGGDMVTAPVLGHKANIGHYALSQYHGHIAGLNMAGTDTPMKAIPFFWTSFFEVNLKYSGYTPNYTMIKFRGDLEKLDFEVFYIVDSKVKSVLTIGRDRIAAKFAEFLHEGKELYIQDLAKWP